jgi:GTP-binding protein
MSESSFSIAIVGRPNVGKSSLFNALLGYRRTIVLDLPGTTMDEVCERVDWSDERLVLIDSQGIFDEGDRSVLERLIQRADAFVMVVDALAGPTPFDRWIATVLHMTRKKVLLCVNKIEGGKAHAESDFAELGFEDVLGVSATHRFNLPALQQWCRSWVETEDAPAGAEAAAEDDAWNEEAPAEPAPEPEKGPLKVALVGRPNTGKSTMMNRLCGQAISRVSPEPLTTRDPVTHELTTPQGEVRLFDTAGMRRPRSQKEAIEVFSIQATTRTIREADVVFLLLASSQEVSDQDMRLLNLLEREGKPAAVLLNFWDQLGSARRKKFFEETEFAPYLQSFRCLPVSGLTGFNTGEILPLAFRLHRQAQRRIKTSKLNKVVSTIVQKNPPPTAGKQNFNILYASQVRVDPPTFVFFMNRKAALPQTYRKYLENQLRDRLGFKGQSIRVLFRGE